MKRFYKTASAQAGAVLLDSKPVLTPGRHPLELPTNDLAAAIAAEWDAQDGVVRPETMPLMALASTALDVVGPQRAGVVATLSRYGESDMLCYRADDDPALAELQAAAWQPLLDWAALTLDAQLAVTRGIMPVSQPPAALTALRAAIEALDLWQLTGLQLATGAAGSLVIGLALIRGRIDPAAAFSAAEIDASYQLKRWGEDPATTARRNTVMADLAAAHRFADLAQTPTSGSIP